MYLNKFLSIIILYSIFSLLWAEESKYFTVEVQFTENQSVETLLEFLPKVSVQKQEKGIALIKISPQELSDLRASNYLYKIIEVPKSEFKEYKTIKGPGVPNSVIQTMVNNVSQDSLASYILTLQNFGTRYEYSPQQDSAGVYIYNKFVEWGLQAEFDTYAFGRTTIYDIDFANPTTSWLVGTSGMIVKTTDAGETWFAQTSGTTLELYGVDFIDENTGFAVGQSGLILKTTNGGNNWTTQTSGVTNSLYDVKFIDSQLGLIVGASGRILRTTNGGTNWSIITSGTTQTLRELQFVDQQNAWAVGTGATIRRSTDGGLTWSAQSPPAGVTNYLRAVSFVDNQNGWIVGDGKVFLKTTNGGTNWIRKNAPAGLDSIIRGVSFIDLQNGWAVDYSGIIIRTVDGGESWAIVYSHPGWSSRLTNIEAANSDIVLACGSYGNVYKTSNGGINWNKKTSALPPQYIHVSSNIVATIPGSINPEKECVIVAHYDSYSSTNPLVTAPGANDNATGTAAVMEAARLSAGKIFKNTMRFVAVSGEELGMFGSDHYAFKAKNEGKNIIGAINGDMIGYPTTADTARLVVGSYQTPNRLVDSSFVYNQRYGIGLTLTAIVDFTGASDYGPFALAGYDALDVAEATAEEIWGGADPYYHSPQDTYDKLKPSLIRKGAQLMLASVAELAEPVILGSISGKVYYDLNRDSSTIGDSVLSGWTIKLYKNGTLQARTITDVNGNYNFTNLTFDTYTVEESLHTNWNQSIPRQDHPYFTNTIFGENAGKRAYILDLTINNDFNSIDFGNYSNFILQNYTYNSGWNLVSIPIKLNHYLKSIVFPDANSDAFRYDNGYISTDTLSNQLGYWLKFPSLTEIQLYGEEINSDTIDIKTGWNLIGSIVEPLHISSIITIPDGIISSDFYEYLNGYKKTDIIMPGKGYWIKSDSNGKLILKNQNKR